jgi:hypothetical protein
MLHMPQSDDNHTHAVIHVCMSPGADSRGGWGGCSPPRGPKLAGAGLQTWPSSPVDPQATQVTAQLEASSKALTNPSRCPILEARRSPHPSGSPRSALGQLDRSRRHSAAALRPSPARSAACLPPARPWLACLISSGRILQAAAGQVTRSRSSDN